MLLIYTSTNLHCDFFMMLLKLRFCCTVTLSFGLVVSFVLVVVWHLETPETPGRSVVAGGFYF